MLRDPQEAQPYIVPDVADPSAEEWARVARWRQPVAAALSSVLSRFLDGPPGVTVGEPQALIEAVVAAPWGSVTALSAGELRWWLALSAATEEALVAAALAVPPGGLQARGSLAQAAAGALAQALGQALGQTLELRPPFVIETRPGGVLPWPGPGQLFGYLVEFGGAVPGTALLAGDWQGLRPATPLAPVGGGLDLATLESAEVALEARLPGVELSARDLWELRPGDVIRLGPAGQAVNLCVEGQVWARGRPGARGNRLAVSVDQTAGSKEGN